LSYYKLLHRFYNFFRVLLVFGAEKDFADDAFFVDHKSGAVEAVIMTAIQLLGAPYAIFIYYLMIGVGQQGERKGVPGFEFQVFGGIVGTDAEHYKALLFEQGIIIAQVAGLDGAGGGIVLGIEIQDYFMAFKIGQGHFVTILVFTGKYRGLIAFF